MDKFLPADYICYYIDIAIFSIITFFVKFSGTLVIPDEVCSVTRHVMRYTIYTEEHIGNGSGFEGSGHT